MFNLTGIKNRRAQKHKIQELESALDAEQEAYEEEMKVVAAIYRNPAFDIIKNYYTAQIDLLKDLIVECDVDKDRAKIVNAKARIGVCARMILDFEGLMEKMIFEKQELSEMDEVEV